MLAFSVRERAFFARRVVAAYILAIGALRGSLHAHHLSPSDAQIPQLRTDILLNLDQANTADGDSGFVVVDGTLWFSDQLALQAVVEQLMLTDQVYSSVPWSEGDVLDDFAHANDFVSLRHALAQEDVVTTHHGFALSDSMLPDPYFQALLNHNGELVVGNTLYVATDHALFSAPVHLVGGHLRSATPVNTNGMQQVAAGCWTNYSVEQLQNYDSNRRRLRSKIWVHYNGLWGSIGGESSNEFYGYAGWFSKKRWRNENADSISIRIDYAWSYVCPSPGIPVISAATAWGKDRIRRAVSFFNSPVPYVNNYFRSQHNVTDNGSSASRALQF